MVSQMFASRNLTFDSMVIVVLAGVSKRRGDECSTCNEAGDFGNINHDGELLVKDCLQAMVMKTKMIVVTRLVL
jgi:hypothetical protein